jgi:hypothetical protein
VAAGRRCRRGARAGLDADALTFRGFRLIFGASTLASAAMLAIFVGGLGAGGLVLDPRAERRSGANRATELTVSEGAAKVIQGEP